MGIKLTDIDNTTSDLAAEFAEDALVDAWQEQHAAQMRTRDYGHERIPFWISCLRWIADENYIVLYCNPSTVEFSFPWREAEQETKGGIVRHSWYDNKRKTYMKDPKLNFTFQTGNILPRAVQRFEEPSITTPIPSPVPTALSTVASNLGSYRAAQIRADYDVKMAPGLVNMYAMMELLDEQRIWKGRPNYVQIGFNSWTFPVLTLVGFFDPSDFLIPQTAENPNSVEFSISFTMRESDPHLTKATDLINQFKGSALIIPSLRR